MSEPINIPNNTEIDKALKEFEAGNAEQKQKASEAPKVSEVPQNEVGGVKFEVPRYGAVKYYNETTAPKMIQLTMKWFKVGQRQAEYILFGFVIVAIGISLYLFFGGKSDTSPINITDPALSLPAI